MNRRRKSIIVIVAAVLTVAITGWAKSMLATPDAAKVTGASGCCAFGSGYYHSPPLW